ncbi:Auxin-responsive protein IAA13 [Linum perenne]
MELELGLSLHNKTTYYEEEDNTSTCTSALHAKAGDFDVDDESSPPTKTATLPLFVWGSNKTMSCRFVKVKMEGVAIVRKIDLNLYHSYHDLIRSLLCMFPTHGTSQQYIDQDYCGNYTLSYQDQSGDWLLAGQVPWQTFIRSVQRIEILRRSNGGIRII